MGLYNQILACITCPHCKEEVPAAIDIRIGDTRQMEVFSIGDTYIWLNGKSVKNGGRPTGGSMEGEGYTVCPECRRDFFVKVKIANDVITAVEPDMAKSGYIDLDGDEQGK
jgi:hypothetical protein